MTKNKKTWVMGLVVALIGLMATPAFARSINLKDAGITLWVFIVIGVVIVLLQLIPAALLFFSFIGTSSSIIFKGKRPADEEGKLVLPGYKTAPARKG